MGTNTKILYGSVIAVLFTLMLLFFSMSRNSQLKLDAEQSGQLVQQKGQVYEVLQQQLKATESVVESVKTENTVIPELQATIDAGIKEKQSYLQELGGLQSELKAQKNTAADRLAQITSLQEKYADTEQENASIDIQLVKISDQYASLQKIIGKRDEKISQLAQSIKQKNRDIEFHIEQSRGKKEELSRLKSTTSTELLNLNVVLDELVFKSRLIDEFTSKSDESDVSANLPEEPSNTVIVVAPIANTEIVSLVEQPGSDHDMLSLERERTVYAEGLRVSETELNRANITLEQIKAIHQAKLFAVIAENTTLGSKNETLIISNREQGNIIQKLQGELRKKNSLKSTPQKSIVGLLTSNQRLKSKVDKYQIIESSLQKQLVVLKKELVFKEDELSHLSKISNSKSKKQALLIQNLRITIEQKGLLVSSGQEKNTGLQASNRSIHKRFIDLSRAETKLQDELIQLRTKLAAKQNDLDSAREQSRATALLGQSLQTTIEEKEILISSGQEKNKQLQISNRGYQGDLIDFRHTETKLRDELNKLKTELAAKQNELDFAKEQTATMQSLRATIEEKELLINSDQEQIQRFQDELSKLKIELTAKQNEIDTTKDRSDAISVSLQEKVTVLEQQLLESSAKRSTFEGELSMARTTLAEFTQNKDTLSNELGLVKIALDAEIAKFSQEEKTHQSLTTEFDSVKLALVQSEEKAGNLNTQYEELDIKLKAAESSLQKAVDENVQAIGETQELGRNIQNLTAIVAEKETAIQNLMTQLAERTNEVSELKSGVEKANILQADDSNKIVDQEQKIAELVAKIGNAAALSDQQMTTLKATEEQLAFLGKEKEELALQLQNAQKENVDLVEQSGAVKQQFVSLEEKAALAASLAGTISSLELTLSENQTNLSSSQEKITALEARIASLEDERTKLLLYTVDTDSDGVSDAIDKCADTEQATPVNKEGCEEDADNDGVANRFDLCSDTIADAETDNAGCSAEQSVIVLSGITFQFGTANLTEEANAVLNTASTILKKNTVIRMEVAGHTDSVGDTNANQWLSTSRAKAVLDYLVSSGVKEDQLQAKGYGSTEPVADNNSSEGRAKNRRVELRRL